MTANLARQILFDPIRSLVNREIEAAVYRGESYAIIQTDITMPSNVTSLVRGLEIDGFSVDVDSLEDRIRLLVVWGE